MYMQLVRLKDDGESTVGTLSVDGEFECFTLEDTHNEPKIYGKTRIPAGTYDVKLRREGGMHAKYSNKYENHDGMLWLQDVNNFEWVYIHTGNDSDDTDGCILVGRTCDSTDRNMKVLGSVFAYEELYEKAIESLEIGEKVTIQII